MGAWVAIGVGIGVGIGTAIFAATGQAFWLAIGVGTEVGMALLPEQPPQNGSKDATAGIKQSGTRSSSAAPWGPNIESEPKLIGSLPSLA